MKKAIVKLFIIFLSVNLLLPSFYPLLVLPWPAYAQDEEEETPPSSADLPPAPQAQTQAADTPQEQASVSVSQQTEEPEPTPEPTYPPSCTPDCSGEWVHCSGETYDDGCGGTCTGTRDCSTPEPTSTAAPTGTSTPLPVPTETPAPTEAPTPLPTTLPTPLPTQTPAESPVPTEQPTATPAPQSSPVESSGFGGLKTPQTLPEKPSSDIMSRDYAENRAEQDSASGGIENTIVGTAEKATDDVASSLAGNYVPQSDALKGVFDPVNHWQEEQDQKNLADAVKEAEEKSQKASDDYAAQIAKATNGSRTEIIQNWKSALKLSDDTTDEQVIEAAKKAFQTKGVEFSGDANNFTVSLPSPESCQNNPFQANCSFGNLDTSFAMDNKTRVNIDQLRGVPLSDPECKTNPFLTKCLPQAVREKLENEKGQDLGFGFSTNANISQRNVLNFITGGGVNIYHS